MLKYKTLQVFFFILGNELVTQLTSFDFIDFH